MSFPLIPWQPSNIPVELQDEMDRRRRNISMNFVKSEGSWEGSDWNKYKGPMTAWIRVCSNGRGRVSINREEEKRLGDRLVKSTAEYKQKRFIFFGGKDFQSTFGLKKHNAGRNSQIIGYKPDGKLTPHTIENDINSEYPIHVPSPEISRIEMTIQKEILRRATIEWVCFSWKQLEYMTPYFLVPGITCMVEMGWNHFNPQSLVNIEDEKSMKDLWDDPYPLYRNNIINSKGNYDVIYGLVTNFNWSVEGNNRYICTTEITSKNRLYAGISIDSEIVDRSEENLDTLGNLKEFINADSIIDNFRVLAKSGPDQFVDGLQLEVDQLSHPPKKIDTTLSGLGGQEFVSSSENVPEENKKRAEGLKKEKSLFLEFINGLMSKINSGEKPGLRKSYLHCVFDGRDYSPSINPQDFDSQQNHQNVWFSMGLISIILNYFSDRLSVSSKKPFSEMDIDDATIGAHRNLISSDGSIMLIPNRDAPKYFWGGTGVLSAESAGNDKYLNQEISRGTFFSSKDDLRPDDYTLYRAFYINATHKNIIPRDDHNEIINYRLFNSLPSYPVGERSFPHSGDDKIDDGERGKHGYIRDIYFNINKFRELVNNSENFYDLVNKILKSLNEASANFWDLKLVDSQKGYFTITDLNYSGDGKIEDNEVMVFDMHDANNIVKSFRFRPQLSDSQATRVLYGNASNPATRFYSIEERESLDYEFKDALLQNNEIDSEKSRNAYFTGISRWQSVLRDLQVIDDDDKSTCQMTFHRVKTELETLQSIPQKNTEEYLKRLFQLSPEFQRQTYSLPLQEVSRNISGINNQPISTNNSYFVKLALPPNIGRSVLRKLLDDGDFEYNPKYCAIQPGINAEITMQGIGGLRTFQCFQIRNLPEPYSEENIIFQIVNVMDHVEAGNWETTIVAGIRPLRKFIAKKLGIIMPNKKS